MTLTTRGVPVVPTGGSVRVTPARRLRGTIRVPGDKSISHRAALLNALADGGATVRNYSEGADCVSTVACLRQLGVGLSRDGDGLHVRGVGPRGLHEPDDVLDCGNSGTTMRFLCGVLAGQDLFAVLNGDGSLRGRPMARVVQPLRAMGARIAGREDGRLPPLAVQPAGSLHGMTHRLPVASAQVKSALLLAGLSADGPTVVESPAASRDHTERLLAAMGADITCDGATVRISPVERLRPADVEVPGDFSAAAFWLVLGCLHPDAELTLPDVGVNPTRTGLLTVLERMGANVELRNQRDVAGEPVADLVARSSGTLRATEVGGDLVPLAIDEIPLVALLGCFADGETVVRDAGELRVKESDRLSAVAEGLGALGAELDTMDDGWLIRPSKLQAGTADSHDDHRLAMLFALAGTLAEGVEVLGADCVSVSYPRFWDDLAEISQ